MEKEERIRTLELRADQLRCRAKILAAQENRTRRAKDTKRRILLGACIADAQRRGQVSSEKIISLLNAYLVRDGDRALFGLAPIANTPNDGLPCP